MLSWMVAEAKGPLLEARQCWNRSDFQCSYKEPPVVPQQRTGVEWGRLRGRQGSASLGCLGNWTQHDFSLAL